MMKIAILGGSFDPPHLGHLMIANQILEKTAIEQVWLMPNYSTATHHKVFQKQLTSAKRRYAMTKLLETDSIIASDFEILFNKKSLTITTLEMLSNKFPQNTFYWISGSDKLENFHLYDDWEKLVRHFHLIIFPREQILTDLNLHVKKSLHLKSIPENIIILQNKNLILTNISSTIIRERVKNGLAIDFLVTEKVKNYIIKNDLYV